MPFFVITKKTWLNVHLNLNIKFTDVTVLFIIFSDDDIFVRFRSKDHWKRFVNYLNSKHKNIKFTFETEDLEKNLFLNVKVTLIKKRFNTSIFGKVTFSGVFTNYNSFIFDTYKIGLFHTLLFQFVKIVPVWKIFI